MMGLLILLVFCTTISYAARTNQPVWVTSSYFQAGNQNVINSLTSSSATPNHVFNFATAFPAKPLLAYGLGGYEGGDWFGQERFYIQRMTLSPVQFGVKVRIVGSTYIWLLNVPYIAINPQFPHRIISFDNVPAEFNSGSGLTIFSSKQTTIRTYTNIVNFTQQAAGLSYNTFLEPLSRNKIVLFTSCFYIVGSNQNDYSYSYPLTFENSAVAISSDQYKITVKFGIKAILQKVRFSQIIFDQQDILDSLKYSLENYQISVPQAGGFYPLPQEFFSNLMVGFVSFYTDRTKVIFDTKYTYTSVNGKFGINFPRRITAPRISGATNDTVKTIVYNIFYLKTWYCPSETPMFDQDLQLCTECDIPYCTACSSASKCKSCDPYNGYTLTEDEKCQPCDITLDSCPYINRTIFRSGCNQFTLVIEYDEEQFSATDLESTDRFLNFKAETISVSVDKNIYTIIASYKQDLPSKIEYELSSDIIIRTEYSPSIPAIYYTEEECQIQKDQGLLITIQVLSYLMLGISVVASAKIVGLEIFGLLQFAYFNLADNSFWNIHLAPLANFSHLNGINTPLIGQKSSAVPTRITDMKIYPQFLDNCNIMLFLLFIEMIVGACLFIASKFLPNNKKLKRFSRILLKEGLITFVMFNTYNITFSAGIHWNYSDGSSVISSIMLYAGLAAIIGTVIGIEVTSKRGYGEFKDKFKKQWPCFSYVCLYILYQGSMGIYMSTCNEFEEGTFIIIGFCIFYSVYFYVNLPYKAFYHNYRAGLILFSQMSILLITNYYRSMKSTTQMPEKARINSPAIFELCLLFICVIFSAAVLAYEIYLWVKERFIKSENKIQQTENQIQPAENNQSNQNIGQSVFMPQN